MRINDRGPGRQSSPGAGRKDAATLIEREVVGSPDPAHGPDGMNLLIKGDNLAALTALRPEFEKKIPLIYIDPPFNIKNPAGHYPDRLLPQEWIEMMRPRLERLRSLLKPDGVIFVHIDQRMVAELKLLMNQVFGADNFVSMITIKVKDAAGVGQQSLIFDVCEFILVYAARLSDLRRRGFNPAREQTVAGGIRGYDKAIADFGTARLVRTISRPRVGEVRVFACDGYRVERLARGKAQAEHRQNFEAIFADYNPSGGMIRAIRDELPARGLCFIEYAPSKGKDAGRLARVYFLNRRILAWLKDIARLDEKGRLLKKAPLVNLWEFPNAGLHAEGGVEFRLSKKPEALLKKIIELGSNPGDWVLDCFLGSGTTAAAAHKLGRRWIGIESGDHLERVALPRLRRVVSGEDRTGISRELNWTGGGGFKRLHVTGAGD